MIINNELKSTYFLTFNFIIFLSFCFVLFFLFISSIKIHKSPDSLPKLKRKKDQRADAVNSIFPDQWIFLPPRVEVNTERSVVDGLFIYQPLPRLKPGPCGLSEPRSCVIFQLF